MAKPHSARASAASCKVSARARGDKRRGDEFSSMGRHGSALASQGNTNIPAVQPLEVPPWTTIGLLGGISPWS